MARAVVDETFFEEIREVMQRARSVKRLRHNDNLIEQYKDKLQARRRGSQTRRNGSGTYQADIESWALLQVERALELHLQRDYNGARCVLRRLQGAIDRLRDRGEIPVGALTTQHEGAE